jgi:hypothetical protein
MRRVVRLTSYGMVKVVLYLHDYNKVPRSAVSRSKKHSNRFCSLVSLHLRLLTRDHSPDLALACALLSFFAVSIAYLIILISNADHQFG